MDIRDRAYQYAKFFRVTKTKRDYLAAVEKSSGNKYLSEAEAAWETIDQWEGEVNPR